MLEPHAPEIHRELAADRVAALREAARGSSPGPVRRAIGNVVVRLGVLLGGDRTVSPAARHESYPEALASAGVSSLPSPWAPAGPPAGTTFVTEEDLAWERAAPYGPRVAAELSRRRSRSGFRPAAPSARTRGSRRRDRFDAR